MAVVETLGQNQDVAGEAVASDVGDLPRLGRVRRSEGPCDGSALLGAARVVPSMGAGKEDGIGCNSQPGRPSARQAVEVELKDLPCARQLGGLHPRQVRVGVRREDARGRGH